MEDRQVAERLTEIDRAVGAALARRRLRSGQPVERLAETAGMTPDALLAGEEGRRRLSASELFLLCQALDIQVGELFVGLARGGGGKAELGDST